MRSDPSEKRALKTDSGAYCLTSDQSEEGPAPVYNIFNI